MTRRLAILASLVALALPAAASADHGDGVRWASSTVRVGDCTSERWRGAVRAAVARWSQAPYLAVRRVRCGRGDFQVRSRYYGKRWAGNVERRSVLGTIVWARVRIEERYDLDSLVCHELGHALGLGHYNRVGSCMWPGPSRGERPTVHDLRELGRQYR